ncbi:MAG TPA: TetR family transcriptional regulator [Pseudonocardiaceae bacterium]|jgi:AcrR family transcriptional regulator|nr:TetR family transcriptional regulator [Pseudonocardiaceae bacterium]
MEAPTGLRERKKQRTYQAISHAAISLFLARGFEEVSVVDVAAEAEVSKRTLFKYFPTKEDLVLHVFADHEDEAARVVRARRPNESPLAALHAHFLAGLDRHDAATGLCDEQVVAQIYELLTSTPTLAARLLQYSARSESALATALAETDDDPLRPRVTAAAIVAVQRTLAQDNQRRMTAGESAQARHPAAVAEADQAFTLLRNGFH